MFGADKVLPSNRPKWENPMVELGALTDQEIADGLNYTRLRFANVASTITPKDVAAQRAKMAVAIRITRSRYHSL